MMTQNAPILPIGNVSLYRGNWWLGRELNPRRRDFQNESLAGLPAFFGSMYGKAHERTR